MSKIIVITGAGLGLGRALARRFARDGETVVLIGRNLAKVEAVAQELGGDALAIGCDVADADAVRAAFARIAERFGRVDVLINNAAVYEPFLVAEASDAQILNSIAINVAGPILCARAAIPLMAPGSCIINVGSESAEMRYPHLVLYQTSKAAIDRFSRGLMEEVEPQGIRVTLVVAGAMYEPGKTVDFDPEAGMRFHVACLAAGLDLRERPISHVDSVTGVFRSVIDLPPDVQLEKVTVHARKPS